MRKLFGLVVAVAMAIGVSAPASASTLTLSGSVLDFALGGLPNAIITQTTDVTGISVGGSGTFVLPAGVMAGQFSRTISGSISGQGGAVVNATAFFTGVSLISSLSLSLANGSGTMSPGGGFGGGFGGDASSDGNAIAGILLGLINLNIPLAVVGGAGSQTITVGAKGLQITVTGMSWTTGTGMISKLTTTTPNGAVVNTVTVTGADNRTAGGVGHLILLTPTRVLTNAAGNLPAPVVMTLNFVPEPGTLLLLGFGFGGLMLVGRRRMNK